jgi:hypothetical protein
MLFGLRWQPWGESMRRSLDEEAAACRKMAAAEFAGRPEAPFLLQLASALDEAVLVRAKRDRRSSRGSSIDAGQIG